MATHRLENVQKYATLWAERREREIAVRIYYDVRETDGCTVYSLKRVEELF